MSIPVPDLTAVEIVFPAHVLDWAPRWDDIPEHFRSMNDKSEWSLIAHTWFNSGLAATTEFHAAEGVDAKKAVRALKALLGSFQPKHEHKIAAAAYLLSCWFTKVEHWRTA